MKIKKTDCKPGIYVIRNTVNGKIYVGKSNNIYKRLHLHKTDIKYKNRNYNENPHLLNSVLKYGLDNFEYFVIEYINNDDNLEENLYNRELFWIKTLNSLDRNVGYNLRLDSDTKCICSEETKTKISNRLKKEWKEGKRDSHSDKLKEYWKDNKLRSQLQSELFSRIKTKYEYEIYQNNILIKKCNYKELKELGLASTCLAYYCRHKTNECITKGYLVKRLIK